ncbi:NUDIX domain-containing protein [Streptomyces lydicus]|uniref:NUDIX domain-containing protein n=1 Tax=Streptomyces lydicus TaxID=47763 RepID=UPI0036E41C48
MAITDPYRRVLMLTPRRAHTSHKWQLPGSTVRQGETPQEAVQRAVNVQLGLDLTPKSITAVTWTQVSTTASPPTHRDRVCFTFTTSRLSLKDVARIHPHHELVRSVKWVEPARAQQLLDQHRPGTPVAEGLPWTHTQRSPAYNETQLTPYARTVTC